MNSAPVPGRLALREQLGSQVDENLLRAVEKSATVRPGHEEVKKLTREEGGKRNKLNVDKTYEIRKEKRAKTTKQTSKKKLAEAITKRRKKTTVTVITPKAETAPVEARADLVSPEELIRG